MTGPAYCRGFSLLEVLVAFTILAMLLGALFQVFGGGLRAARVGDDYSRATVIAQSRLAEMGAELPIQEGVTSGSEDEKFDWRVVAQPYADPELPAQDGLPQPLRVDVEVFWEEGGRQRSVSLTSVVLAPAQP